jgi:hypothetical protein
MESYLSKLMSSSLPIAFWALILLWLILFAVSHVLSRKGNDLVNKQNFIVTSKTGSLVSDQNWKLAFFVSSAKTVGRFFRLREPA